MISPLEREPVIVFTCGRTGSTLLIRILNCLPETVVWGEHGGIVKSILRSHAHSRHVAGNKFITQAAQFLPDVLSRTAIRNSKPMSIEWLNWFNEDDMDELYRKFIISLFYPPSAHAKFKRWGFKEIRYRAAEYEALRELFPRWKPIILFRNPVDVCTSQLKSFAKGDTSRIPQLIRNISDFYAFTARVSAESAKTEAAPLFINYETMVWQFDEAIASLETYLREQLSPQIELIRAEVVRFASRHPRRGHAAASDVEHDLRAWAASTGVAIPRLDFTSFAHNYEALASRTAGQNVLS